MFEFPYVFDFIWGHYQTLHWSTSTRDPRHIWENNSWVMDLWVHWPWTFLYLDMYMFWVNMMTGTTEIFSICQPQQNGIRFSDIFKYIWNSLCFDSNFIAVLSQKTRLRIGWSYGLVTTGHKPLPKPMRSVTWWRHQWKHFPRYWLFVTGHRWIPLTKASDAELWCFLWSAPG